MYIYIYMCIYIYIHIIYSWLVPSQEEGGAGPGPLALRWATRGYGHTGDSRVVSKFKPSIPCAYIYIYIYI